MYDKVKFWINRSIIGEQYPIIAYCLDNPRESIDIKTGEIISTYGNLENLKVAIYVGGLSVVGSLPKYLYGGSNVYPLDRHSTAKAIEKIEDSLKLKINGAAVTEVEFGTNFIMKHKVSDYIARLGEMPRLTRCLITESSLQYRGKGRQQPKTFVFYNKIADAISKGMQYPTDLEEVNLLRYEMRLKNRLPKQLGVPVVTASTLIELPFYKIMIKRYQDSYFSISKLNQVKNNIMNNIKTVKDAYDVLTARLISQEDPNFINNYIAELKGANVFKDPKYYTRLKRTLKAITAKANFTESDELIRELDDDIKNCGAYV